ncbi:MAG: hypothetical protein WBQ23_02215 [Bacteroidota bacterium]
MKAHAFLILFIGSLLFSGNCLAQEEVDAVYLKNGSKILGTIVEQIPNKQLKIRTRDGSEFVYTFDEIEVIRKETIDEPPIAPAPDLKDASYYELGVNIGTPAGINLAMGKWFGIVGARLSGMYFGDQLAGLQGNIGFKLSDNRKRSHVLAAIFGASHLEENYRTSQQRSLEWTFVGAVYELNLRGFFVQGGLTVGSGDFSSPQAFFQIGYMYRFLPD